MTAEDTTVAHHRDRIRPRPPLLRHERPAMRIADVDDGCPVLPDPVSRDSVAGLALP